MKDGYSYNLNIPNNYSLEKVVLSHGWVFLDPFRYDYDKKELTFVLSETEKTNFIKISQIGDFINVESGGELSHAVLGCIERALALDESTLPLIKKAKRLSKVAYELVQEGFGRLLKSTTLWEDLAKTLLTTNCNWRKTQSMTKNLCDKFGIAAQGRKSFPSPMQIIEAPADQLQECGLGYRFQYLTALAEMCDKGELSRCENKCVSTEERVNMLSRIRGFGPYSVSHSLVLLKDYSHIPIDSDSAAYLKSFGFVDDNMKDAYASWGQYRFWGYKLGRIARKLNWIGE